ncbi:MAG TPA: hypothetical protein VNS11_03035 [Sphingomicrobium sp.]|nr:hypothetical protein [Sphingomicrobium sp.]
MAAAFRHPQMPQVAQVPQVPWARQPGPLIVKFLRGSRSRQQATGP